MKNDRCAALTHNNYILISSCNSKYSILLYTSKQMTNKRNFQSHCMMGADSSVSQALEKLNAKVCARMEANAMVIYLRIL